MELGPTRWHDTTVWFTWLITDANEKPLGYFVVNEEVSRAVIEL